VTHRAQARRMTLRLERQKQAVALTLPPHVSLTKGLAWAKTKSCWIAEQLDQRPPGRMIEPGMTISVGGEDLVLDWSPSHRRTVQRIGDRPYVGGPNDLLGARVIRWLRAEARCILTRETQELAARAGVTVAQIGVGDPVSRWGSCAANGAIRYSWRLVLAPYDVMIATVAHEVAHRIHMNHSREFHTLVATILGKDPSPSRLWLRRNGAMLHGFGVES
jgi:predicted metal-dependent hydrolase